MYVFYWKINAFLRKTGKDIGKNRDYDFMLRIYFLYISDLEYR